MSNVASPQSAETRANVVSDPPRGECADAHCPAPPGPATSPLGWIARSAAGTLGLDEAARRAHNAAFERDELERLAGFFERVLPQPLNDEQRAAIVVDEDAALVVAAAGSGKTTLLLGKIAYLVRRGLARPEEIALLAFNNSVRAEIRDRLAGSHPGVAVHTFHSLGLHIVRDAAQHARETDHADATGAGPRLSDMADGEALQRFIGQALLGSAAHQPAALAEWLAGYTQPLRDAADFATRREWLAWARHHPPVTLRGERVASQPLREALDRLLLAGVRYQTGVALAAVPGLRSYTPDVLLTDARLVVDLGGVGSTARQTGRGKDAPGILARVGRECLARLACLRHRLRRVRLADAGDLQREGRLAAALAGAVAPHGLDLAPRALTTLAATPGCTARIEGLASLLATCIGLYKGGQSRTGQAAPQAGDALHGLSTEARRERVFATLFDRVLARYEAHLRARGEIDFNDMIVQAVDALDRGAVKLPFRYLLVDEFQDISAGRAELVKALRRARPDARLLAVGDDWQSIYRFAGSDVGIMTAFESHFGHTETRFLRQTFRFDRRLEAVASAFVLRNPAQIRKQVEARAPDTDAPSVVLWLPADDEADDPLPAIAEELLGDTCGRPDILVLGRYRALEAQAHLDRMAASYPQAAWRYSTIHRAKGATADYAVILGVRGGRQPFPAERGEDPLLARFLGIGEDFPHAEERRLFYVALTRARHRVYVVGDRRRPSSFFAELLEQGGDIAVRDRSRRIP